MIHSMGLVNTIFHHNRCHTVIASILLLIILCFVTAPAGAAHEYALDDLYRIALEMSEKIKISEEDVIIAEKGREKAVAGLIPKLSAFGNYTRYSESRLNDMQALIQPLETTGWGVRLDQLYSLGGKEFISLDSARKGIDKSIFDLYATRERYLFTVASAFYDALRAKRLVEISQANVERLKKQRDAAAIRLKVGEATKTVVLRAEAELSGAQSELIRSVNSYRLAKAVLARTVGLDGPPDFELKEAPLSLPGGEVPAVPDRLIPLCPVSTLDCFREVSLRQRAEMKSQDLQARIAQDGISSAKSAYWPTLSIEGVYIRSDQNPEMVSLNKESVYGGLKLNFPFFEGGLRKAEVGEAEAKYRQAELSKEDLRKTILIDVEAAYVVLVTAAGVLKSLQDQLVFAKDNYSAVSKQFEFGLATSIDIIDANTLLVTAERQFSDAQLAYQFAILGIERTTGTLLQRVAGTLQAGYASK